MSLISGDADQSPQKSPTPRNLSSTPRIQDQGIFKILNFLYLSPGIEYNISDSSFISGSHSHR